MGLHGDDGVLGGLSTFTEMCHKFIVGLRTGASNGTAQMTPLPLLPLVNSYPCNAKPSLSHSALKTFSRFAGSMRLTDHPSQRGKLSRSRGKSGSTPSRALSAALRRRFTRIMPNESTATTLRRSHIVHRGLEGLCYKHRHEELLQTDARQTEHTRPGMLQGWIRWNGFRYSHKTSPINCLRNGWPSIRNSPPSASSSIPTSHASRPAWRVANSGRFLGAWRNKTSCFVVTALESTTLAK